MMDYQQYIADFNTGDDERLVEKYFHPDIIFTGSSRKLRGTQELLGFLRWAHNGIREIIRDFYSAERGYRPLELNGIPLRDEVILDLEL